MKFVYKQRAKQRRSEPEAAEQTTSSTVRWTEVSDAATQTVEAVEAVLAAYEASKGRYAK